jgi:AraC-like DNA-binding protein
MATAPQTSDWARYDTHSLPGVQLLSAHFLTHKFERHSHAEFAIGVTSSGIQSFSARGTKHHSQAKNIIVFNPEVAHDGMAGHETGFGYQMVYIQPELIATWCDEYFADHATRYLSEPLIKDPASAQQLQQAFTAMRQPQESLRAQTLLTSSVMALFARHGRSSASQRLHANAPQWIHQARDFMRANYANDITNEELCALAGVSRIHFNRVFTRFMGSPAHAYLNSIRIQCAQQLLRKGSAAVDVALSCGFSDQSHLIRRFKGSLGITPAQWQKLHAT